VPDEHYKNEWINRSANMMHMSLAEFTAMKETNARVLPGTIETASTAVVTPDLYASIVKATGRPQHEPGRMNKLEAKYAQHLELRSMTGEIKAWAFEPLKLKLAPSTFYNVDFIVVMVDGRVELHETKGHWEDDARVKIKVAATMFPWWQFVGVQWSKEMKDWKIERFRA